MSDGIERDLAGLRAHSKHTESYGAIIDASNRNMVVPIYMTPNSSPLNILCVCRQLYHECATLAYALNTFDFATPIAFKIWYAYRKQGQIDMVRTIKVNDDILFVTKHGRLGLQPLTTMFPKLKTVVMGPYRYDDSRWQKDIKDEHMMDAWGDADAVKRGERDDLEVVFEPLHPSWKNKG